MSLRESLVESLLDSSLKRRPRGVGALYGLLFSVCASCAMRPALPSPVTPLVVTEDAEFRKHPPQLGMQAPLLEVPKLESATLPNGLTLWVVSRPALPYVALSLSFRGAGPSEACSAPEVLTLTVRALVQGGLIWTDGNIVEPPQVEGRKVTSEIDATHTELNLQTRRSALSGGLQVLARTARYPALGSGVPIDVTRLAELKSLQRMSGGLDGLLLTLATACALGQREAAELIPSRVETARNATLADIKACYSEAFRSESAALIAVGDVTLEELRALAEPALGDWKSTSQTPAASPAENPHWQVEGKHVHLLSTGNELQAEVLVLQPAPATTEVNDTWPFALLAELAVGSFGSRTNRRLRHTSGLTYGIRPRLIQTSKVGLLGIRAAFPLGQVSEAINALLATLDGFKRELVSEEELNRGKAGLTAHLQRQLGSNTSVAQFLAQAFAEARDAQWLATLPKAVSELTAEDVRRAAQKYLRPADVDIAVAGHPSLENELAFVGRVLNYSFDNH